MGEQDAVTVEPVRQATVIDDETVRQKYLNAVPLSELDAPFVLVDRGPIEFPDTMRTKNYVGETILLVTVDERGRVIDCQIDEADHESVAEVIREEISKRKFSAPLQNGEAVTAFARLPVPYRIGSGNLYHLVKDSELMPSKTGKR